MKKIVGIVVAAMFVAGCTPEIAAEIYLADVVAVLDGEAAAAPAIVSIEIPSKNKCDEYGGKALDLVRRYDKDVKLIGCRTAGKGFQSLADLSLSVPIINAKKPPKDVLAAILVQRTKTGFRMIFQLGEASQRLVKDAAKRNVMFSAPTTLKMTFDVQNDTRDAWSIETSGAFADGAPVQMSHTFSLERRKPVRLVLSNVAGSVAAQYRPTFLFDAQPK